MRIDQSQFIMKHEDVSSKFYTKKGDEDYIDENSYPRSKIETNNVVAKALQKKLGKSFINGNQPQAYSFYIKTDPNKNIYNPTDFYTIEPKIKSSFVNKICKTELVFTEVPESIFNKYLNFLKTENEKWLIEAQRELK